MFGTLILDGAIPPNDERWALPSPRLELDQPGHRLARLIRDFLSRKPPFQRAEDERLGALVHQKTATCVAVTSVDKSNDAALKRLTELCRTKFNDNADAIKTWGGGVMGLKTQAKLEKRAKAVAAEEARKASMMM